MEYTVGRDGLVTIHRVDHEYDRTVNDYTIPAPPAPEQTGGGDGKKIAA